MAPEFQVFSLNSQHGRGQDLRPREYRKRKTHLKSKAGCASCKSKRVKCDETRPICRRCSRNDWKCSFHVDNQDSNNLVVTKRGTAYENPQSDLRLASSSQYAGFFDSTMSQDDDRVRGTCRIYLLRHYQQLQTEIWGLLNTPQVFDLAKLHPFLLHAMFAVSASHLRYHYSKHPNALASTTTATPYRLVEHAQQSLALSSFQEALYRPIADPQTSDGLLITAMLLNILTFSFVESEDPSTSWVFADSYPPSDPPSSSAATDPTRKKEGADGDESQSAVNEKNDPLSWFSIQLGLKPLLIATGAFRSQSILQGMFAASDDGTGTFVDDGLPLDHVPEAWLALCCPASSSTRVSSINASDIIFHDPVRILAVLRSIPPEPKFFFLYMSFFGKLGPDFRDELRGAVERGCGQCKTSSVAALWLLGYWLGILCRFDNRQFWWLRGRAKRDHNAIRMRLRQGTCPIGLDEGAWETLLHDLDVACDWPLRCSQTTLST